MEQDVLTCRLDRDEAERVRQLARLRGTSVSAELRRAARALLVDEGLSPSS